MTRQVRILSAFLGFALAAGLLVRPPDAVRAQAQPAPQAAPGQRQPGAYPLGPDSLPQDGVPKGKLDGPFLFKSQIIAGTVRRYWIYVPAQYTRCDAGQRPRLPGWPARDQPDRLAARAAGAREPDSQEGHPGHHRHLHHARPARRCVSGGSRHRQSEQPRRRVRLAERRLRAVHRGRDAARGRQDLQPDQGPRRDARLAARAAARFAPSRSPGTGRTSSRTSSA